MTEREYVVRGDLRTIQHAIETLRHIVPENNSHVPLEEHQTVMRLLSKWQDDHFAEKMIK